MPFSDWRDFIKKELYEEKFPTPFTADNVQHNYRVDGNDIREGMLAINACFLRFIEYEKSGFWIFRQKTGGFLGTVLRLPLQDIDHLRRGEGDEKRSLYVFLKSINPTLKHPNPWKTNPFYLHLVYIKALGRYGMRFHFIESDPELTIKNIRESQTIYEKWLRKTDPTVLGKECPTCGSALLIPTHVKGRTIVECGHCGKECSPDQLREVKK